MAAPKIDFVKLARGIATKVAPKTTAKVQTGLTTGTVRATERKAASAAKRELKGKSPRLGAVAGTVALARQYPKTAGIVGLGVPGYLAANSYYGSQSAAEPVDLIALGAGGNSDLQRQVDIIKEAYAQDPELESYLRGMNTAVQTSGGKMYENIGRKDLAEQYKVQQQGQLQRMLLQDRLQRQANAAEAIANAKLANVGTQAPLLTQEVVAPVAQAWDQAGEDSQRAWAQANGFENLNEARNAYIRSQLGL